MKAFVLSLILLAALILGVIWNYIYINDVFATFTAALDAIPDIGSDACVAACESLRNEWKKHTDTVGLSVCFPILDRVTEQTELLLVCASAGDRFGFESARALLRDALEDMRRLECLSIGNLL